MSAIEFQEVSKTYGNRTIVSRLSFKIEKGERITVHGPSGCGKTTVLRLLAGFLAPDEGAIGIGDQEVASKGKIHIGPPVQETGNGLSGPCLMAAPNCLSEPRICFKGAGTQPGRSKAADRRSACTGSAR